MMDKSVEELTDEELEKEIKEVTEKLAIAKDQLGRVNQMRVIQKKRASPAWFRSLVLFQRERGSRHQELLRELGQRNRLKKEILQQAFDRRFVDVAKQLLPPDVFKEILNRAKIMT